MSAGRVSGASEVQVDRTTRPAISATERWQFLHGPFRFAMREHRGRHCHEDIPLPATPLRPETERDPHRHRMLVHHGLLEGDIAPGDVRNARHAYLANCIDLDSMVGKLLDTLETIGSSRETAVLFTSDHGDMLGERGMWLVFMVRHGPFKLMTGGGGPDVLFDIETDPEERNFVDRRPPGGRQDVPGPG